ncbi:hypothetical protein SOVF_121300 isoform B [Spinacia oleracea]|nr:hypothetical protein SOVF_121300 isoform B [Spinacia oleracea]
MKCEVKLPLPSPQNELKSKNTGWGKYTTQRIKDIVERNEQDPNACSFSRNLDVARRAASFHYPAKCHVRATPIFELSSITVRKDLFKKLEDENESAWIEVYGHIKIVDEENNEHLLFDCPLDNPESVYLSDNDSVLLQECFFDYPYWSYSMHKFSLVMHLKDRRGDVVIADDVKEFDLNFMDVYDVNEGGWKIKTSLGGGGGHVYVQYRIFPYAVYAFVDVKLWRIVKLVLDKKWKSMKPLGKVKCVRLLELRICGRKRPDRMAEDFPDIYDPSSVHPLDVNIERIVRDPKPMLSPDFRRLVEIFSISVPLPRDQCWKLYGLVHCYDLFHSYDLFSCKEEEKEKYTELSYSRNTLLLQEPCSSYIGGQFGVSIILKNDQGSEISKGWIDWNDYQASIWYNRRVCSIIPGKIGFAAVHYTIFSDAVQAGVKVVLKSNDGVSRTIRGKIFARYSGYTYQAYYEKKYYKSKLYEDCVEVRDGERLPLLKPVVSVPKDGSLVLEIYIQVGKIGKNLKGGEYLKGEITFKAFESDYFNPVIQSSQQVIHGADFSLSVFVLWG